MRSWLARLIVALFLTSSGILLSSQPASAKETQDGRFPLTVNGITLSKHQFHHLLQENNQRLQALDSLLARTVSFEPNYQPLRLTRKTSRQELTKLARRALELDQILDMVVSLANFHLSGTGIASALLAHRQEDHQRVQSILDTWRTELSATTNPSASNVHGSQTAELSDTNSETLPAELPPDIMAKLRRGRDFEIYFGTVVALLLAVLGYAGWQAYTLSKLQQRYALLKKAQGGLVALPAAKSGMPGASQSTDELAHYKSDLRRAQEKITHLERINDTQHKEIVRLHSRLEILENGPEAQSYTSTPASVSDEKPLQEKINPLIEQITAQKNDTATQPTKPDRRRDRNTFLF